MGCIARETLLEGTRALSHMGFLGAEIGDLTPSWRAPGVDGVRWSQLGTLKNE